MCYGVVMGELTDGREDTSEAEIVDRVEGEQMEEKLLLLFLTAEEGVTLVQLPVGSQGYIQTLVQVQTNITICCFT